MSRHSFDSLGRMLEKEKDRKHKELEIDEWQQYWREAGPIRFAEELLTCPSDVPSYPDFDPDNNPEIWCNGCQSKHPKFRDNGTPYHIVFSSDQKEFLNDLWKKELKLVLLAAGRGAGKTFCLAIWVCWQISTQDRYSITCMGGSSEQSELIQEYIDNWRIDVPMIGKIIHRSLHGIKRVCHTLGRSKSKFPACSQLSSKGPHVNEVHIDECCAAEDKSEDGAKAVKSVMWQLTGKRVGRLILTSTADYVFGMFYEYLKNPKKYGFTVYQWGIAKHVSGKKPKETYTDKDPTHWKPNVWWLTQDEIEKKRRTKSDEEWLSMALGGTSMASGAVFKKKDLDICICNLCNECEPYNWEKCKLCKMAKLGTQEDPTKYILERMAGFDYGVSEAPCALTVIGRKGDVVFVLFNDEQLGLREDEKVSWIEEHMKEWKTWTLIPDPAASGKHLNEPLEDRGYAVYIIPEHEKAERVFNVINFVEKHKIIIPKAFWYMTQSLRKLAWKDNKIRKVEDHSFDTLQYALVDFRVEEGTNVLEEFLKETGKKDKKPTIDDVFGIKW